MVALALSTKPFVVPARVAGQYAAYRFLRANAHLHVWLRSLFGVVDSDARHQTWQNYKLPDYLVDFYGVGFPCQPFARCANKLCTKDIRFSFVIARLDVILCGLKPKCALLENTEHFASILTSCLRPLLVVTATSL